MQVAQANRSQRLQLILQRDGPTCVWCGRRFEGLVRPTTEHLVPRLKGGPSLLVAPQAGPRGPSDGASAALRQDRQSRPACSTRPSWLENEVTACRRGNGQRSHASLGDWADECERRGWAVDRDRLVRTLEALGAAIAERGGQRRARPWLASQLRRFR